MLSEQNQKDLIDMPSNKQLIQEAVGHCINERSHIYDFDEDKLFTDDKIKEEFKTIIRNQDAYEDKYQDKIMDLVDTNFIIPCYVDSTYLEKIEAYFFKEKKNYTSHKNIMGFWNIELKRMFILVRHIQNIDYWGKNSELSSTLTHEFQHCFLNLFPNSFLNLHRQALDSYYSSFLKSFFGIRASSKNSRMVYQYLIKTFDSPKDGPYEVNIRTYFEILEKLGASKKDIELFKIALLMSVNDPQMYSKHVQYKYGPAYHLYKNLKQSYSKLGIVSSMIHVLCSQEAMFAGEVICVESEYNRKSRHMVLLDKLHIKDR